MVNFDPALARYDDAEARDIITAAPEGFRLPAGSDSITVQGARVDEGFFTAIGIPIVSGRPFAPTDTAETPHVAVVNTTFANRYWPGQSALEKRIRITGRDEAWAEIVGVAATIRYNWVAEGPTDYIYLHRLQNPT